MKFVLYPKNTILVALIISCICLCMEKNLISFANHNTSHHSFYPVIGKFTLILSSKKKLANVTENWGLFLNSKTFLKNFKKLGKV